MIATLPFAVVSKVTAVSGSSVHPERCRTPVVTSSCDLSAEEDAFMVVAIKGGEDGRERRRRKRRTRRL